MKTLRLVLPLIVLFVATITCSTLDPQGQEEEKEAEALTANARDTELAGLRTATALAEMQATDAALTAAAALTLNAAPPSQITEPQAILRSGAYQVDVITGSRQYHSTWTLEIVGEAVTGNSTWDCCPGARVDSLSGSFIGEELTLVRDCSGQGFDGPCTQTYSGRVNGNIISGTITGTGIPPSGASWTLYLSP